MSVSRSALFAALVAAIALALSCASPPETVDEAMAAPVEEAPAPSIPRGPAIDGMPGLDGATRYAGPLAIKYLGNSAILIMAPDGTLIACDPYAPFAKPWGMNALPENLVADAVTVSHDHDDHSFTLAVGASPTILNRPGTCQVGMVKITGLPGFEGSPKGPSGRPMIIFVFECEGAKIVHLGDSGPPTLPEVIAAISDADLLIASVDMYVITRKDFVPFLDQVRARTILPTHYGVFSGKPDVGEFLSLLRTDEVVEYIGTDLAVTSGMSRRVVVMRSATQQE